MLRKLPSYQVVVNLFSTELTSLGACRGTFSQAHYEVLLVLDWWTGVSVEHCIETASFQAWHSNSNKYLKNVNRL